MARAATPTPPAPVDVLADLREQAPAGPPLEDEAPPATARPVILRPDVEPTVGSVVDAFHKDTVALGGLHKGGICPCAYLARLMIRTAMDVQDAAPPAEAPEDSGHGG